MLGRWPRTQVPPLGGGQLKDPTAPLEPHEIGYTDGTEGFVPEPLPAFHFHSAASIFSVWSIIRSLAAPAVGCCLPVGG